MDYTPAQCETQDSKTVFFDIPYTEADDHDETWKWFDLLATAVGK